MDIHGFPKLTLLLKSRISPTSGSHPANRTQGPKSGNPPAAPASRRGTINAIILNAYIEKATHNATGDN